MTTDSPATRKARVGEIRDGSMTFPSSPAQFTPEVPSATSTAPMSPPIRACEELDGNPRYHVMRFHTIAPIKPENTTVVVI